MSRSNTEAAEMMKDPLYPRLLSLKYLGPKMILRIANYYKGYSDHKNLVGGLHVFDEWMTSNPYRTAEVPYWDIDKLDELVVSLPNNDPYHVDYGDENRIHYILKAMFIAEEHQGRSILTDDQYRDVLIKTYCFLIKNTPDALLNQGLKNDFVKGLKSSRTYQNVNYQDYGHLIVGKMDQDYFKMIKDLAMRLIGLAYNDNAKSEVNDVRLQYVFHHLTKLDDNDQVVKLKLTDEQEAIVKALIHDPISMLTGYAGTGKSTLVKALVQYLTAEGVKVHLCATSGKASFNLRQITGVKTKTIAATINTGFLNPDYFHQISYLIIDEISMVNERQLASLLKLVGPNCHLIMIGDKAQLPAVKSVGVMITLPLFLQANHVMKWHNLTKPIRQDDTKRASHDATQIRQAITPTNLGDGDESIHYQAVDNVEDVVKYYVDKAKGIGRKNLLVITPMNRDVAIINQRLQSYYRKVNRLNSSDRMSYSIDGVFHELYVGDKILINHNMKDVSVYRSEETMGVYNGFVGHVVAIVKHVFNAKTKVRLDPQGHVVDSNQVDDQTHYTVKTQTTRQTVLGVRIRLSDVFDQQNQPVEMEFFTDANIDLIHADDAANGRDEIGYGSLEYVQLGYALTVHKSQGSTIPRVITYVKASSNPKFVSRQLLYTALTRGKRMDVLIQGELSDDVLKPFVKTDVYKDMTSNLAYELNNINQTYQQLIAMKGMQS